MKYIRTYEGTNNGKPMSLPEAQRLIETKFFKLINDRLLEVYPDIFIKSRTRDKEKYENANGNMNNFSTRICNVLLRLNDGEGKYKRSIEER